jgi:drug/metabolite transporter (DMT)-like permease
VKARELVLIVLLGSIWGMSYVFIRVAAPVLGPVPLMEIRFALAGSLLVGSSALGRGAGPIGELLRREWRHYLVLGALLMALPTTLIGYAELRISASLASVLNASVPFFTATFAALWLSESFSPRRVSGLLLGFAGVVVAVGGSALTLGWEVAPFAALSIGAAASYGLA